MVLMRRKDIIERYGFDPGEDENQSVVPKNEGSTAAINVKKDDEEITPPNKETNTADLVENMVAGAAKGFSSDPLMLYGLGAGVLYWAKKKLQGDPEASFADGLYQEGGVKNIQDHINQKYKEIKEANPDWNDIAVRKAIEDYTASPEFFEVNIEQMTPALKTGLRTAHSINKATGVNKTPDQETFIDDTMQTLGGLLTPTGFLKVGNIAEKVASKVAGEAIGKAAKVAGNIADFTVLPGTPSYKPGVIAGNVGGGMVVDEVVRHATGDPTVLPTGEALIELSKNVDQLPSSLPEQPRDLGRSTAPPLGTTTPLGPPIPPTGVDRDTLISATQKGDLGTAAVVGAGVAGLLAGRAALRGRVAPTIPPTHPSSTEDDFAVRRFNETGLNAPENPNLINRVIEKSDEAGGENAPIYQLGRELGVEPQIEAEVGQYLSTHGQALTLRNIFEDGVLPDGTRTVPVKQHFDLVRSVDEDTRFEYQRAVVSENVLSELGRKRQDALTELQEAGNRLVNNPRDPALIQAHVEATRTSRLWNQYDPSIRRYQPNISEAEHQQYRYRPGVNPGVDQLMESRKIANNSINEMLARSGVISSEEAQRRAKDDPYHTGLFEYSKDLEVRYKPEEHRNPSLGPATQRVHNPMSPEASMRLQLVVAARASARNLGKRNIARELQAADPLGREIREVPRGETPDRRMGGFFEFRENGRTRTFQVARPHVADAINQSMVDDGIGWNIVSSIRTAAQFGMVQGPAAIGQAPVSAFYDMTLGWLAQRSGTSYGYLSRWLRQFERANFGDNVALSRTADIVDSIDFPGRIAAYTISFVQASVLRSIRATGTKMMTQAITRDGFFSHLANTIPNGHQVLANIGGRMNTYFTSSWYAAYREFADVGAHQMVLDVNPLKDQVASDIRKWSDGSPEGVRIHLGNVLKGYTAILDSIQSLNRMTFAMQQHAIANTGGPVSRNELRVVMEQARRTAGDLSEMPGSEILKKASKGIPFFRIGLQSFRYLTHALTSRGAWDSTLVAARLGALAGAMYTSHKMIEEMGLSDWYYETLNDFERVGILRVPTAETVVQKLVNGQQVIDHNQPDKHFYSWRLPPEASLYMGTIMYGLEQLGWINRGSNRGNTSAEKDLLYAASQTFNVGNIPLVNLGFTALTGKKIDLTAGMRGRMVISDNRGPRAQYGDMASGIPTPIAEAIKSTFGFTGNIAIQTLDAGLQSYQRTGDAVAATARAWDEAKGMFIEKSLPSVPGLWEAREKVYNFSAMSIETDRTINQAKEIDVAYQNEFTSAGHKRGSNRRRILDDDVKRMLYGTHTFMLKGYMPKLNEMMMGYRNKIDNIKAGKAELSYEEIEKEKDRIMIQMRPLHEKRQMIIQKYNKWLKDKYADKFRAEGLEPNIDGVITLVKKYSGPLIQ